MRAALTSALRAVRLEPAVLVALACAFVAVPWLRGEVIGREGVAEFYTRLFFIAHQVRMGVLPAWYPHVLSGMPLLADSPTALLYPLTMPLARLLSPTDALNTWIVVHVAVAGLSMYLYLGSASLAVSRPGRFLGAAIYMLACPAAARILAGDTQRLAVYALIPIPFYLTEEIIRGRQRVGAAVLGGAAIACQFLAGDPQTLVYATLVLVAYAVVRLLHVYRQAAAPIGPTDIALRLVIMFGLAGGFGAIQALPTLQLFLLSNRHGLDPNFALIGSMPPLGILSLLAPRFFGDEVHGSWGEVELRAPDFYVHSSILYVGFFTLALVIIALYARRDRWHVRFFGVTGLLVLWIALGRFGYLYRAAVYLPVLKGFRDIEDVNQLIPLCAAVLAAAGFDRYLEPDRAPALWRKTAVTLAAAVGAGAALAVATVFVVWRTRGIILFTYYPYIGRLTSGSALFALAALGLSAWLLRLRSRAAEVPAWHTGAVIVFVVADLLYAGLPFVTAGSDLRAWERDDAITRYLGHDPSLYRVTGFSERAPFFGVQDAEGQSGLLLARYSEYTNALQGFALDEYIRPGSVHGVLIVRVPRAALPLLDLLNVKYVLRHVDKATAARLRGRPDVAEVAPGAVVFTNPGVLPRVLDAYGYQVLHDRLSILRELIRPGHDPRRQVILEDIPDVPAGSLPPTPAPGPPADLRISSYAPTRVVIHARFARPGFLVLNDLYYPAWTATVDGRPARIYRANYLFRAVAVSAGDHDVRFVYRDRFLDVGAGVSGLTLIVGLLAWLADRRRRAAPGAA